MITPMNSHAVADHEHVTAGLDCWCVPTYFRPCTECEGEGCWACEKGRVEISHGEAEAERRPIVIVHHRVLAENAEEPWPT